MSDAEKEAAIAAGILAVIGVPLIQEGRLVAQLGVQQSRPREWTSDEIIILQETAERTWAAVERANIEAALRQREAELARIQSVGGVVGVVIDVTHGLSGQRSPEYQRLHGLAPEQTAETHEQWIERVHPDDRERAGAMLRQALAGDQSIYQNDYRIIRPSDGQTRWISAIMDIERDADGRPIRLIGAHIDITQRKLAETALRESEARFRLLVEGARDFAMFLLGADEQITFWSVGAERVFGWSADEMIGQHGDVIFTPEDRERGAPEHEIAHARATGRSEDRRWHIRKDGTRIFMDGVLIRLDDEQGRMRGFAKIGRDATAQRQAEEALQQAHADLERRVEERTAELAQLSAIRQELLQRLVTAQEDERGSLARNLHDSLGQYLTALTVHVARLQAVQGAPPEIPAGLEHIQAVAAQLDAEVDRLTTELRPLLLDDFGLDDALARYAEEWSTTSGIPVDVVVTEPNTPRLPGEVETTAYRIVQEALTNVRKHAQAQHASIIVEHRANLLRVIVEDDGAGFDTEATRRERSGGRQLGLVGMAERAGLVDGTLTIESQPDRGTTIYLDIPLAGD